MVPPMLLMVQLTVYVPRVLVSGVVEPRVNSMTFACGCVIPSPSNSKLAIVHVCGCAVALPESLCTLHMYEVCLIPCCDPFFPHGTSPHLGTRTLRFGFSSAVSQSPFKDF